MAVELDYMEYADDAAAQAAYVSSDFEPGSWDLLDEDCSGIGDWDDIDTGNGESSVSPAGQFKFDSGPTSLGTGERARRVRDIGSFPDVFTVEIKLYHDALGTWGGANQFWFECYNADENMSAYFGTDGLFTYDTDTGWAEIGTDLVKANGSAEWQTWRFVVDLTGAAGVGVMDVYLLDSTHDWEKVGSAVPCSKVVTEVDGHIYIAQLGNEANNRITHMDYMKIYAGSKPPSLQCFSESTLKEQGSYSLKVSAQQTDSLNDTLTRSIGSPIDLSDQTKIAFDVRASRTGSQFKIGIHDAGGTTTEHTVNISEADTWQEENWDISGVSNANKDAIDEIKVTVLNADAENVFYLDYIYALSLITITPSVLALALTLQTPITVNIHLPGSFPLELSLLAPDIIIDSTVSPAVLALALTLQTPTVGAFITVLPSALAIEASLLVPSVSVFYTAMPPFMHKDLIDPYGGMGAWLWLAEIVVPTQTTQRIARNTAPVVYGITSFVASNFDVGRIPLAGDGSVPRIQLRVAQDETGALEDIVNATKGGENGTIKLIRTCEKYFDSPVKALERTYDILTAGSDSQWVTFVLGIPNPLTQRIPLWSYSSKVCPLATPSLFKGPRCQYAGVDTVCTGLLEDCYTKGNAAHWGAEAGLDPAAVRI